MLNKHVKVPIILVKLFEMDYGYIIGCLNI